MTEPYGLPAGTSINYKALGFPAWVDQLCLQWGLDSSTYPGHQEGDRPDIGSAPNPDHLNRGIDWAGDPQKMQDFARWLIGIAPERQPGVYGPPGLEMVIFQDPRTGEQLWYPQWVDFSGDLPNHTDHVHTRFSASVIDVAPAPLPKKDQYASAIIEEGQRRGITPRGIQIALATALVESNLTMYANSNDPASLLMPHDAVGSDHMSVGLFQQQNFPPWPSLECRMDAGCSAGAFYAQLEKLDYNGGDSPGSYAQAVQGSAFPDRYDQRWDEAVTLYNRLVATAPVPAPAPQPPPEDWMTDDLAQMIRDIHQVLFTKLPSKSRYGDPAVLWTVLDLIRNDDGFWFDDVTERNALRGDQWSQVAIEKAAARGDPLAKQFYNEHASGRRHPPQPQPTATAAPPPPSLSPQPSDVASINATIMALAAQMQQLKQLIAAAIG